MGHCRLCFMADPHGERMRCLGCRDEHGNTIDRRFVPLSDDEIILAAVLLTGWPFKFAFNRDNDVDRLMQNEYDRVSEWLPIHDEEGNLLYQEELQPLVTDLVRRASLLADVFHNIPSCPNLSGLLGTQFARRMQQHPTEQPEVHLLHEWRQAMSEDARQLLLTQAKEGLLKQGESHFKYGLNQGGLPYLWDDVPYYDSTFPNAGWSAYITPHENLMLCVLRLYNLMLANMVGKLTTAVLDHGNTLHVVESKVTIEAARDVARKLYNTIQWKEERFRDALIDHMNVSYNGDEARRPAKDKELCKHHSCTRYHAVDRIKGFPLCEECHAAGNTWEAQCQACRLTGRRRLNEQQREQAVQQLQQRNQQSSVQTVQQQSVAELSAHSSTREGDQLDASTAAATATTNRQHATTVQSSAHTAAEPVPTRYTNGDPSGVSPASAEQ